MNREDVMSAEMIKQLIANQKMTCPECQKPIQKFDKYAETIDAVRDGFNILEIDSRASRVTLTCGNGDCKWSERTEYWANYIDE
jgi:hypothetical protein